MVLAVRKRSEIFLNFRSNLIKYRPFIHAVGTLHIAVLNASKLIGLHIRSTAEERNQTLLIRNNNDLTYLICVYLHYLIFFFNKFMIKVCEA